jgi:predicted glycosyltransferase
MLLGLGRKWKFDACNLQISEFSLFGFVLLQENQAPPPRPEQDYDVVIVGGGMVGAAVGCGLGMYEFFSQQPLAV